MSGGENEDRDRLIAELRSAGIVDERVLSVMADIPRENFVPETFSRNAWDNTALPIGYHQTISQPQVVAMMTEALELNDRIKVLEIGTGSGYQAVILSRLCRRLYTIERHKPLLDAAEARFSSLGIHNITTLLSDGSKGWPAQAPFERIMVTAAAHDVPPVLIDQLAVGGIMVIPIGDHVSYQRLYKVTKTEDDVEMEDLGGVRFVPLVAGMPGSGEED